MSSEALHVIEPKKIGPYVLRGTVGDGAFSVVKLVCHEQSHQYYACKIVPRSRINTESLQARFEIEIRINQQLHHPGIVHLYDLLKDENNYYVIMEFCPNGELFQYIVDRNHLSEDEARPFIRQILETLEYIHSMGITHRDLKPENLLLDQLGHVKFSDFGLSRFIPPSGLVDTPCGSPCYASPECISGKQYDGKTTDVWSIGVILYAMLTGQLPWTKRNQAQLFAQIKRGEYQIPTFLSETCRSFLRGLMTVDITKRLTIDEALKHPWMEGVPEQYEERQLPAAIVSLRMVDRYFCRDMSDEELGRLGLKRIPTTNEIGIGKTVKMMKMETNSMGGSKKSGIDFPVPDLPSLPHAAVGSAQKIVTKPNPTKASRAGLGAKQGGALRVASRNLPTQGSRRPAASIKGSTSMLRKVVAKPNLSRKGTVH